MHNKEHPKWISHFFLKYTHSVKHILDISATPIHSSIFLLNPFYRIAFILVNSTHWIDKSNGPFSVLLNLDHLVFDRVFCSFIQSSLKHFIPLSFSILHFRDFISSITSCSSCPLCSSLPWTLNVGIPQSWDILYSVKVCTYFSFMMWKA